MIVKSTAHNVPTITIGHLDQNGKDTLHTMLKSSYTVDEIIEYFKNYVNSEDHSEPIDPGTPVWILRQKLNG